MGKRLITKYNDQIAGSVGTAMGGRDERNGNRKVCKLHNKIIIKQAVGKKIFFFVVEKAGGIVYRKSSYQYRDKRQFGVRAEVILKSIKLILHWVSFNYKNWDAFPLLLATELYLHE